MSRLRDSPLSRRAQGLIDCGRRVGAGLNRSRSLGLAAEMAFWLFFSLLPLAAVAGLLLARIAVARGEVAGAVLDWTPPEVRSLMATQLGHVAQWNGGTVGPVAAGVFIWLASSGVHSVFDALETQAGVERPWWKKRALALASCVGLALGMALLAVMATGAGWLFRLAGASLPHISLLESHGATALRVVFGLVVAFGLVAGLYAVGLPRAAGRPRRIWPGAALAVVLEALGGLVYGLYVHTMGTGDAYQAGLGIVGVTLMSLYLFCLALLVGAELNQSLGGAKGARPGLTRASDPSSPDPTGASWLRR